MTSPANLPVRDDLRGQTPYGAPQLNARIALNVNENTHPLPEFVIVDIALAVERALRTVNRYPDREFSHLRDSLAGYLQHGLSRENLWAANGSNEIVQQVLQTFGGPNRTVLGFPPTYSMHSVIAASTGTAWASGERDDDFEISPETALHWIKKTNPNVVFFCSPNNPTGTPVSLETIIAACDATDGIVLVDEAYAEFAPEGAASALSLLSQFDRLVVSRTMSKAFAFAGARLGYVAAAPAVCDALRLVRLPYHVSSLTQAAAIAALAHAPTMLATVDDIREQRDRLIVELATLGFTPHKSWANFVLFGGVRDPQATFEALLTRDILIRDLRIPGHLRVSAGTERETTAFLGALADVAVADRR